MGFKKGSSILLFFLLVQAIYVAGEETSFVVSAGTIVNHTLDLDSGDTVQGSMTVSGGSGNDVVFTVKDPNNLVIIEVDRVSIDYSFNFVAELTGTYTLGFDNTFSFFSDKSVDLTYSITPNVAPEINSPNDVTYDDGETGYSIIWIATDLNPDFYIIYKNGNSIQTDNWVSNNPIVLELGELPAGVYTYKIDVYDSSGLTTTDEVTVTVKGKESDAGPINSQTVLLSLTSLFVLVPIRNRLMRSKLK